MPQNGKRSICCAFLEGKPVYGSSYLYDRSHVQICVRDQELIQDVHEYDPGELTRMWNFYLGDYEL